MAELPAVSAQEGDTSRHFVPFIPVIEALAALAQDELNKGTR